MARKKLRYKALSSPPTNAGRYTAFQNNIMKIAEMECRIERMENLMRLTDEQLDILEKRIDNFGDWLRKDTELKRRINAKTT